MITTLSVRSRITSSSYSFQPSTDSSTRTSPRGERCRPQASLASNSSAVCAIEPPEPPSVKLGRMIAGSPISSSTAFACSMSVTYTERGVRRPISLIAVRKSERSSAIRIDGELRADQSDAEPLEDAGLGESDRGVQRRLAAERRQHGVGPFALEDLRDRVGRDRLDVGARGELGVGHDGGRVGVHQHHLDAFLGQRLARLRARVVELAALPDHDRACADQQDLAQRRISRHAWTPRARGSGGRGTRCRADPARPRGGTARRRAASGDAAAPRSCRRSGSRA